jgi:DNA (cytosine-5)-methyltransferase 1
VKNPGAGSEYTPEVRRYFDLVPEGGNWRAMPPAIQKEALGGSWAAGGGKTGFYRRLSWSEPSPTITGRANRKGSALCHPSETRPLSVRECAALQGFPEDWQFSGAMNNQYMQVGNAVPVALGRAVGNAINRAEQIRASATESGPSFEDMFSDAVARLRASARNKRGAVLSEAA